MKLKLKRYLGDGVYAGFDGYQIWICATLDGREHGIALDAAVFVSLERYAADLKSMCSSACLDPETLNREQI